MISIGIVLLILGIIVVVVASFTPAPPPINTLGWIALAFGAVLILLGLLLPSLTTHSEYDHARAVTGTHQL